MSMPIAVPGPSESSLGRVLDRLGSTLLSLEAGRLNANTAVTAVVMNDPSDPPAIDAGAIVLGVGIVDAEELAACVRRLADAGAAALVVRDPVPRSPEVTAMAEEGGVAVFGLVRGASWIQIATMLGGALHLESGESGMPSVDTGTDLFALANSLAALLQAAITIEDLSSRVVAFSADQAGTDEGRRLTILGLQVPKVYSEVVRERGVFRQIYTSERPVFMHEVEPGALPRVAVRVKAGDEVLGSIWAVVREPLTPQREQGMVEAARVVALTMLRARVSADSSQRLRLGLVSMLLEGGIRAREAAQQLGFGSSRACVIAVGASHEPEDDARAEAEVQRVSSALTMYLRPIYPRAIAALLGRVTYAVIPLRAEGTDAEAVRLATEFIDRVDTPTPLRAGVGAVVAEMSDLPDSRREADAALRVLLGRSTDAVRVTQLEPVQVEALMLRIVDSLAADRVRLSGPLAVLSSYDVQHGTELTKTLMSWLEHFGDIAAAAAAVHVHKNTFRYRLARLTEIATLNLADSDARFALMLQSRAFDMDALRSIR
jgi:hypothetical protein